MVFKRKNMIVFENDNKEQICLYPEFMTTAISFASKDRKNISVSVTEEDKETYSSLKNFLIDLREAKLSMLSKEEKEALMDSYKSILIDSDIEFQNESNKIKIEEFDDSINLSLIYNTKNSFNCVKILSPYFNGKIDMELYTLLLELYENLDENKLEKKNQKVKKYN